MCVCVCVCVCKFFFLTENLIYMSSIEVRYIGVDRVKGIKNIQIANNDGCCL